MIPVQVLLLTQLEVVLGFCTLLASSAARENPTLSCTAWSGLTVGILALLQLAAPVTAVKSWQSGLATSHSAAYRATLAYKRALHALPPGLLEALKLMSRVGLWVLACIGLACCLGSCSSYWSTFP